MTIVENLQRDKIEFTTQNILERNVRHNLTARGRSTGLCQLHKLTIPAEALRNFPIDLRTDKQDCDLKNNS